MSQGNLGLLKQDNMENVKYRLTLKSLYNSFATHPESLWILHPDNVKDLWDWLKANKVKKVLDLGTGIGCSASIAALALQDKGEIDFHIDSIEHYNKCIKLANQLIPEELKKYITIHKKEVGAWNTEKIPYHYFSIYKDLPEDDYDLIIVDGPPPFMEEGKYIDIPNGNIIKMLFENKIKTGATVIYDGRMSSLRLLERFFGENFYLTKVPPKGSDFNVLEKKGGELIFKDDLVEQIKKNTTYFKDLDEKNNNTDNI